MAITRHAQMNNARVLRSRRVTVTPVNPWSRPGRRSFHRLSTIPRFSISKRNPDPSDGLKERFVSTFPESSAGDMFPERLNPSVGADDGDIHVSPMSNGKPSLPAPNLGSLPSAAVRLLARVTSFEDAILTAENDSLLDSVTVMPGCLSSIPEDIGLPPDGLWDYDAVYEQRYCYIHGEFEYLLTTPDRWISSNDLKMLAAEARLENLLQKYRIDPAIFDPYARRCQAEYCSSIYYQIHSITDKREVSSVILY